MIKRALAQRIGRGSAVFSKYTLFKRPGIHTNSYGDTTSNAVIAYNKLVARIVPLLKEERANGGEIDQTVFAELKKKFTDALDNDLNTSLAVTALYDLLKYKTNGKTKIMMLDEFDTVMTLGLTEKEAEEEIINGFLR